MSTNNYPNNLRFTDNSLNPEFNLLSSLDMLTWRLENYNTETEDCEFYTNLLQRQYIDQYRKMAAKLLKDFCLMAYSEMEFLPEGAYSRECIAPRVAPKLFKAYGQHRLTWKGITYPIVTRAIVEIYGMIFHLKHPNEVRKCIKIIQKNGDIKPFHCAKETLEDLKETQRYSILIAFREIYQKLNKSVHMNPLITCEFLPLIELTTLTAWLIDESSVQNFVFASDVEPLQEHMDRLRSEL